jgi:xanthine dehydrogenase molybdopterin-binding subunit B
VPEDRRIVLGLSVRDNLRLDLLMANMRERERETIAGSSPCSPRAESGAIVQGIGAALWEHCVYDEHGQLLTGSMMDYLVPMAAETPPIIVGHVETPTAFAEGGFKGAGEAGTAGAPGAVLNAVNDALAPFGARVTVQPITPDVVLRALGKL